MSGVSGRVRDHCSVKILVRDVAVVSLYYLGASTKGVVIFLNLLKEIHGFVLSKGISCLRLGNL